MSVAEIAIPPVDLRLMVGPVTDTSVFENPTGAPIYQRLGIPSDAYESVFDFGCGCGRVARQMLLQTPKPRRYVGIDPHPAMVDWCKNNLTTVNSGFSFFHHDVYSPWYADSNSLRLSEPFPVEDNAFSLVIAHSVFTHLCRSQTEYYLGEIARILKPGGVAYTTWLFFDRNSFPFLSEGPYCLYTSEQTFSQAVIYDRRWFLSAVRAVGLRVRATNRPQVCGHQWEVLLEPRNGTESDEFPIGEEAAEWVCGATYKQMAATGVREGASESLEASPIKHRPPPPKLFPVLAELKELRWRLQSVEGSWAWRLGRALTAPVRALRSASRA